jgi:hypothetical protein
VELYLHSPILLHGVGLINYAQGNVYFYFDKLHGVTSQKRVIFNVPPPPPNKLASLLRSNIDRHRSNFYSDPFMFTLEI